MSPIIHLKQDLIMMEDLHNPSINHQKHLFFNYKANHTNFSLNH